MRLGPHNIAIIGAGIGGLASALFLHRQGHKVQLFERFETPQPVGSGLVVQPVGQDILARLGLLEKCEARSAKIYHMRGTEGRTGKSVLDVEYGPKGEDVYGLGIHRGALFQTLFEAVKDNSIPVFTGCNIFRADWNNGTRILMDDKNTSFGAFDLVIDASGARSKLSPIKTRALPFGAIWGTVDWPESTDLPKTELTQCYARARHMAGVLPLGAPHDGTQKAAVFWSLSAEECQAWPNLPDWKDKAVRLWPEFEPFLKQIKSSHDMTLARYSHGTLSAPYAPGLVHIGDAAHQASPQLGQGANMALLDAAALADALGANELSRALPDYAARRWAHVRLYQIFSAVFTPFYQSHSRALPPLRDYVFNPVSKIWPVKPMLTRLVCGNLIRP